MFCRDGNGEPAIGVKDPLALSMLKAEVPAASPTDPEAKQIPFLAARAQNMKDLALQPHRRRPRQQAALLPGTERRPCGAVAVPWHGCDAIRSLIATNLALLKFRAYRRQPTGDSVESKFSSMPTPDGSSRKIWV